MLCTLVLSIRFFVSVTAILSQYQCYLLNYIYSCLSCWMCISKPYRYAYDDCSVVLLRWRLKIVNVVLDKSLVFALSLA